MIFFIEMGKEILLQGLIFSFVAMAVFLTSRIIKCDDLSVEGSFGLGGAVVAGTLLGGFSPLLSLPLAIAAGGLAGLTTGILHTKLKIHHLIAGVVVTTAIYSINLKIAHANVSLMQVGTIFHYSKSMGAWGDFLLLGGLSIGIFFLIKYLLETEIGFLMRATGCNPQLLASLGKNVDRYKTATFMLAGACSGLAGGLFVQFTSFFSITGSMGVLIVGLTSLILAEIVQTRFSLALIGGAIICQSFFAITITLGLDPAWNYLIKGLLIVLFLQFKGRPILKEYHDVKV